MAHFKIHLQQKEKFSQFGLLNLKEEIHEMYDDVIYAPSKRDLAFFVLVFFLGLYGKSQRPFLLTYLEENLVHLRNFTKKLQEKGRRLRKDEYGDLKKELGLEEFFKNDTFFVLLYALRNIEYYLIKYDDFFAKNIELGEVLDQINTQFGLEIERLYNQFGNIYIEDDRTDTVSGETLDLSKSVYRTIEMRLSKKVENSIKRFTDIKEIKSQSPIDFIFTQDITPDLIGNVWDQFKVYGHYSYTLASNNKELLIAAALSIPSGTISGVIVNYLNKKNNNSNNTLVNNGVIYNNSENSAQAYLLLKILIDNLVRSDEIKDQEIERLKIQVEKLEKEKSELKDRTKEKRIKSLKIKLRNLVNLSVEVEWDNK